MEEKTNLEKLEEQVAAALGHSTEVLKEKMPQFSKEDVETFYALAFDFYEKGKHREALNFFRFLTTIDYMGKKHWIGVGASLQMLKEYNQAINAYAVAALLDQEDPYVPFYAAECCFIDGNIEKGIAALDCAEELAADSKEYRGLVARIVTLRQAWSVPRDQVH